MAENSRTSIADVGRGRRSMSRQQWGAVIGGSALAIYGITRRSRLGVALAAGGGTLAVLAGFQKPATSQPSTWTTLLVNCTPQEAYRFWRDFENLPRFMNRVQDVTILDNRRSRWTVLGPMGRPIRWDAEITEERENEFIAWRSLPGSDVHVNGHVKFQPAPVGRGTLISTRLQYGAVPGMNGALAGLLRRGCSFAVRQDLRRLEALMESGEIPTIEGQSHGPRGIATGVMRLADPTRPLASGSSLREVFGARRSIA
jgi:uncharacterized membrane protein